MTSRHSTINTSVIVYREFLPNNIKISSSCLTGNILRFRCLDQMVNATKKTNILGERDTDFNPLKQVAYII
jgi:hypothetical protein